MNWTRLYPNFTEFTGNLILPIGNLTLSKIEVIKLQNLFYSLLKQKKSFRWKIFLNFLNNYKTFKKETWPTCDECEKKFKNKKTWKAFERPFCNKRHLKKIIQDDICDLIFCKDPIKHKKICQCYYICLEIIIKLLESVKIAKKNLVKNYTKNVGQKSSKNTSKRPPLNTIRAYITLLDEKSNNFSVEKEDIISKQITIDNHILSKSERRVLKTLIDWLRSHKFEEGSVSKNVPYLSFKYSLGIKIDKSFCFVYKGDDFNQAWEFIWSFNKLKGDFLENCSLTEAKFRDKFLDLVDLELNFEKEVVNNENRLEIVNKVPIKGNIGFNDPNSPNYYENRSTSFLLRIENKKRKGGEVGFTAGQTLTRKKSLIVFDIDSGKKDFFHKKITPLIEKEITAFKNKDLKTSYSGTSVSGGDHIFVWVDGIVKTTRLFYKHEGKYYEFGDLLGQGKIVGSPRSINRSLKKEENWSKRNPSKNKIVDIGEISNTLNRLRKKRNIYVYADIKDKSLIFDRKGKKNPDELLENNEENIKPKKKRVSKRSLIISKDNSKYSNESSYDSISKLVYEENIVLINEEPRIIEFKNGKATTSTSSQPSEHLEFTYYRKIDHSKKERTFIIDKGDTEDENNKQKKSGWRLQCYEKLMKFMQSGKSFSFLMKEGDKGEKYRFFEKFLSDNELKTIGNKAINLITVKDKLSLKKTKYESKINPWIEEINVSKQRMNEKLFGKWLISVSWENVQKVWENVSNAIKNNDLNVSSAKVSKQFESGKKFENGSIVVYTYRNEIDLVREQLKNIEITQNICYKTNYATQNYCFKGGCWNHLICEKNNEDERKK